METTIEEQHAKVTLAKRVHHIGPVRISLANRLPLLGRWTQRGEIDGNTLLNAFSRCRSLKSVPAMLGLDEHPALVEGKPWSMRVSLARVLYHCDLESMFESHELQKKHDAKRKRQALAEEARLLKAAGRGKQDLTYSRVLKGAMEDHFAKQHGNTNHVFYAAPRACVTVTQLEEVLQEPPSKRARLQADSEDDEEEGMALPEDLDASSANVADPLLYFQVSLLAPSEKRVVRVHVGAGGRVQTGVAVTIHGTIDSAASAPNSATVASVATTSSDLVDPVKILQPVATTTWALAAAFDRFVRWTRSSMEWQFKDTSHLGVPHAGLHPILEEMVALGAFPCNDQSLGMTATPEQGLLLQPLKVAGLVKDK